MARYRRGRPGGRIGPRVVCCLAALLLVPLFTASAQAVVAQGWLVWQGAPTDVDGAVAGISASDVWAMGNDLSASHGVLRHWNGTTWEPQVSAPSPGAGASALYSIAATSSSDAWVAGYHVGAGTFQTLIDHYNGTDWSTETTPDPGTSEQLLGIAASSASNVWAVGSYFNNAGNGGNGSYDTLPLHNDGTGWTFVAAANVAVLTEFDAVATLSSSDAWAVGRATTGPGGATEPLVEHWNGSAWSTSFSPTSGFDGGVLTAVYEVSSSDVWAVGSDGVSGLVEHWDGLNWTRVTLPAGPGGTPAYFSVSGSGAENIWIGGSLSSVGFVWHWDGLTWPIAPTPGRSGLIPAGPITSLSVLDSSTAFGQAGGPHGGVLLTYGSGDFSSSIDNFNPDNPTVQLGTPVHLTGILGFSEWASSWGETVHVDRKNPDGTHTGLPDVTADSQSQFQISDSPTVRGTYTYTATYDGTGSRSPASAQTTVTVQGHSSVLELSASASAIVYKGSVKFTAHLTGYGSNHNVSIYRDDPSGRVLVSSGPVDGTGTFTADVAPKKNAKYYAAYDGDTATEPATSTAVPVSVRVVISGTQAGFYKRSGTYRLFHFTASCPRKGTGCPRYTTRVDPNKAGRHVAVVVDVRIGRSWRTVGAANPPLGPKSTRTIVFVYANSTKLIGKQFRIRSLYGGDADQAPNASAWAYFKITR
jgi:hypothetical protein